MTTKLLFNITLTIIIIYIFFIYNVEKLEDTPDTNKQIKDVINSVYLADVDAIRKLADFASNLQTTDNLTLPGQLIVTGEISSTNCFASGNMTFGPDNTTIIAQIKQNGDISGKNVSLTGTITNIGNITLTNGSINVSSNTNKGEQIQIINTLKKNVPNQSDKWIISNTATDNTASGNTASGNTASGNTATDNTATDNTASGNTASGNTATDNTASGNTATVNTATDNTASGGDFVGINNFFNSLNDVNNNKLSFTRMNGNVDNGSVLELYDNGNVIIPGNLEVSKLTTNYYLKKKNRARFIRVGNMQSTDLKELMTNELPVSIDSAFDLAVDYWHLIEIRVFNYKGDNISLNKNVTKVPGTGEAYNTTTKMNNITNGTVFVVRNKPSDNITNGYQGGTGKHLLQIDLEDEHNISHIELYNRYYDDNDDISHRMNGTIVELISGKKDEPEKPEIINHRIHTGIWYNTYSKEFPL
jgi:hypothetical protein